MRAGYPRYIKSRSKRWASACGRRVSNRRRRFRHGRELASGTVVQMAKLGGDSSCISGLVDVNGAVSFDIDVNGDAGGSTHNGTVTCAAPVRIVSEQHRDGGGTYTGSVNGNIYTWHTQCGNFAGVHY